ncbi:MAG: LysR substrate-binding domain-containing protein [Pseudomonadota bacterium]
MPALLELELLRTLVAIGEGGTFARAAERVHRTPAAVSQQMARLQALAGAELFRKSGRALQFTEAGELLLSYGRRLLALHDEALWALRGRSVAGHVRLGAPQDFAEELLPRVLRDFSQAYPGVQLEVMVERNRELARLVGANKLDLAVVLSASTQGMTVLGRLPVQWLAAPRFRWNRSDPLPLAMLEAPCVFRDMAIRALDKRGIRWRLAYVTSSVSGLRAAVRAGLGVTARSRLAPGDEADAGAALGLPALEALSVGICLANANPPPAAGLMARLISDRVRTALG